jgi:tetratricopeptide (TPR) repeat protein
MTMSCSRRYPSLVVMFCLVTGTCPLQAQAQDAANGANAQAPQPSAAAAKPKAEPTEDVDTARSHFKLGVDSYRDGDLTTALIEFKRAYAIAPNYRLLYNLGQVSRELRDYPEAERYFREYLTQGSGEIDAPRRQEVENDIAKATARIASLVITVNEPNAEVFVDDVSVGHAPLGNVVRVSAGQRRISATLEGRQPMTKVVDTAGGETLVVKLDLQPIATQVVTREVVRPESVATAGPSIPTAAIVFGAGTIALGAGAGVMAFLAKRDSDDYQSALQRRTSEDELSSISKAAKTKALVTDVLLGATLACGVTTVVVALTGGKQSKERAPAPRPGLSWQVGPTGLGLDAKF